VQTFLGASSAKEIIFVNGQNYYPYDLENIAQRAPGLDLNKLVAARTGRRVIAGPVEATAAGNVLVQAIGAGEVGDLAAAREIAVGEEGPILVDVLGKPARNRPERAGIQDVEQHGMGHQARHAAIAVHERMHPQQTMMGRGGRDDAVGLAEMAVYLLDTTVIIDVLNNKRGRSALLLELAEAGHTLACCPMNVTEVYAGLQRTDGRGRHRAPCHGALRHFGSAP